MRRDQREQEFAEFFSATRLGPAADAYLVVRDWHTAEDLTQQALAKLYAAWSRIRPETRHGATRAGRRQRVPLATCGGTDRRRRPTTSRTAAAPVDDHAPGSTSARLLALLPPRQRAIVALRFLDDLPGREVGWPARHRRRHREEPDRPRPGHAAHATCPELSTTEELRWPTTSTPRHAGPRARHHHRAAVPLDVAVPIRQGRRRLRGRRIADGLAAARPSRRGAGSPRPGPDCPTRSKDRPAAGWPGGVRRAADARPPRRAPRAVLERSVPDLPDGVFRAGDAQGHRGATALLRQGQRHVDVLRRGHRPPARRRPQRQPQRGGG